MKKFYDALAQDAAFAEELDIRIAETIIAFAAEKGFEFNAEDLAEDQNELSDEDLDNVNAAGWNKTKLKDVYQKMRSGDNSTVLPPTGGLF